MKKNLIPTITEKPDPGKFAILFVKYLNRNTTQYEAFNRARYMYRRLYKTIPYQTYQSFLDDMADDKSLIDFQQ